MSKTKNTEITDAKVVETVEQAVENQFTVSKEFSGAVRNLFGTKPFSQVAGVMPLIGKEVMTEKEINTIIGVLGNYPYDEVANIFAGVKDHVKLVTPEAETK
ncbi:MAG: hypothetical protein WC979_00890 [Candidatus Pacearchaeota archaeon]|jgi:hypothetical protein|nr:hypothetical protein [Clostridia bacterium]